MNLCPTHQLLLVINFLVLSWGLEVKQSYFQYYDVDIVGDLFEWGLFSIKFDEPLYRIEAYDCSSSCEPPPSECFPCNFSLEGDPCFSQNLTPPNCKLIGVFCDNTTRNSGCQWDQDHPSTSLTPANMTFELTGPIEKEFWFKFTVSEPCIIVRIQQMLETGDADVLSFSPMNHPMQLSSPWITDLNNGPEKTDFCPPNTFGTFWINIKLARPSFGWAEIRTQKITSPNLQMAAYDLGNELSNLAPEKIYQIAGFQYAEIFTFWLNCAVGCHTYVTYLNQSGLFALYTRTDDPHSVIRSRSTENDFTFSMCVDEQDLFVINFTVFWQIPPSDRVGGLEIHYFTENTKPEFFFVRKHTDIPVYSAAYAFAGDLSIDCGPNRLYDTFCSFNRDFHCLIFQQIAANDPPAIFWPLPAIAWISPTLQGIWENSELFVPKYFKDSSFRLNDTLQSFMLLSFDQPGRVRILGEESVLGGCRIHVLRPPCDSEGTFFLDRYVDVGGEKDGGCDYQKLVEFGLQLSQAFDAMKGKEGRDLTNQRFELDLLTMSSVVVDCSSFLEFNLSTAIRLKREDYDTVCTTPVYEYKSFYSDPCCFLRLQFDQPCSPRYHNTSVWNYTQNFDTILEQCLNPQCVAHYGLVEYYNFKAQARDKERGCPSVPPSSVAYYIDSLEPLGECLARYLLYPLRCTKDEQCDWGWCDFTSFTCRQNRTMLERAFFECVWTNLDPFLKQTVMRNKGMADVTVEEIFLSYLSPDCVNEFSITVEGRAGVTLVPDGGSPYCDFGNYVLDSNLLKKTCIDPSCWLGFEWQLVQDCRRVWKPLATDSVECLGPSLCNWDTGLACSINDSLCLEGCENFQETTHFCGWCEDGFNCLEIPGVTETECGNHLICIFPNGTSKWVSSLAECEGVSGCNRGCVDPRNLTLIECQSPDDCATTGGRCVLNSSVPLESRGNWDGEIFSTNDKQYFPEDTPITGLCLVNSLDLSQNLNGGMCPFRSLYSIFSIFQKPTQFGCLAFTTPKICDSLSGVWIDDFATSESECQLYGKVCILRRRTNWNFVRAFLNPYIMTLLDEPNCEESGGEWINKTTWVPGRWLTGKIRTPQWIKRQYRTQNHFANTINVVQLRADITKAVDVKFGYSVKTEAYCLYSQLYRLLETNVCDCLSDNQETCFDKSETRVLIGVTSVCNGRSSSAVFPPNQLYFSDSSLASNVSCQDLSIYSRDISLLQRPQETATLSTTLFSFTESTSFEFSFKNKHQTFVGQMLGTGVIFSFDESEISKLEDVTLCSTFQINVPIKSTYTQPDFGVLIDASQSRVNALGIVVDVQVLENGKIIFCGLLNEVKSGKVYIPIFRQETWDSADSSAWTKAELFGGYLLAALYLLLVVVGLYELKGLFSIAKSNMTRISQRNFIIILVIFCSLRSLYFFLLMSGALQNTNSTVDYFFIDFVTLLFFSSFITYMLFMWIRALLTISSIRHHLPKLAILINVFLYTFFFGMIIAFELSSSTTKVYWCGQLISSTPDTSTQDSIKLAYRIVLACVAFFIGTAFFGVGVGLLRLLRSGDPTKTSEKDDQVKRVLLNITLTISSSFILQSIFFLVIELFNISSMAFTVPLLIVVEINPCAVILFSLRPRKTDTSSQATASSTL